MGPRPIWLISDQRCDWAELVRRPHHSTDKNMAALATSLVRLFKCALFVHGTGQVDANQVPIYSDLDAFIRQIERAALDT